jgi:hypothetical protein
VEKLEWLYYKYVLSTYRLWYKKIFKKAIKPVKYAGKNILLQQDGNDYLLSLIRKNLPFMVGRLGSTELRVVSDCIATDINLYKEARKESVDLLVKWSGFFPNDIKLVLQFGDLMKSSCSKLDLIGVWFNAMEDYMVKKYASQSQLSYLRSLEPWYNENPWTKALEGKKVLVIHPFEDTIIKQYLKREKLFKNKDILPKFTLLTLKAVQTVAGQKDDRFETWFEALEYMYAEAMKKDFDIAILGCGAYGFPLAAKIKKAGKQAIHLGGATQLLFGIKGKRWDNHPNISKLYNEYWVRPMENEKPQNANKVEEGCYW